MERDAEKAIVEAVQAGQRDRFAELVSEYQSQAHQVAYALVRNSHDALDLVQDAFLRAFRAIRTFDTDKPFFPWFYRILRNLCLSYLGRRRRFFSFQRQSRDGENIELEVEDESQTDPREHLNLAEDRRRVMECFAHLSERDREILSLRHFQHLPYAEIAEILDIPVGTVMSRLFYARRRLRDRLEEQEG